MKKRFVIAVVILLSSQCLFGQEKKTTMFDGATNIQLFYDFGADRKCVTTTIEGFYKDPWGNSFFFVDHDFPTQPGENQSLTGTYWEIARNLNFWKNTKASFLSLHLEYNGGVYRGYDINHSFLAGLDFFVHSKNFKNTFNFVLMYKYIMGQEQFGGNSVPLQFTFVWGMHDLFGAPGLTFSGFLDIWGEKHLLFKDNKGEGLANPELSSFVAITEPQLWYSVGQHFGCPNLNVGTEIELSYDFGTGKGFWCRPCLGLKWIF